MIWTGEEMAMDGKHEKGPASSLGRLSRRAFLSQMGVAGVATAAGINSGTRTLTR
jgi:hypothetical protein